MVLHAMTWTMKSVTFTVLMVQVALAASGCAGHHTAARAVPPLTEAGHGLSVRLPQGWHRATVNLTPHLTDPREELSVATFPLRYRPGPCAQFPVSAIAQLGPRDALVTLQERGVDPGYSWPDFPQRPTAFGPRLGGEADVRGCVPHARFTDHWFGFTDSGRHFHVLVVFGLDAPVAVRAQAWRILDSLRVNPRVRPDWRATP
ncbi:MAG TPA: hypothetical protein VF032_19840 [Thermoleophilaceae bacterium]